MLQIDPAHRLSIQEIQAHPWWEGETASLDEIQSEFAMRKAKIDEEAEQKRL